MSDMSVYGGSIYAAQADAPARPPLTVEADVDVCVIGGGTGAAEGTGWPLAFNHSTHMNSSGSAQAPRPP